MNRKLFKRAQSVNSLGQYVMVVVTVDNMKHFTLERKQYAREKINSLFMTLSAHPDYIGCFERGLTMFNDDCFGICCEAKLATSLKNTIERFTRNFNFDLIISSGYFETMNYAECDTKLYGGDLYNLLRYAHKLFGVGKKFFKRVRGKQ